MLILAQTPVRSWRNLRFDPGETSAWGWQNLPGTGCKVLKFKVDFALRNLTRNLRINRKGCNFKGFGDFARVRSCANVSCRRPAFGDFARENPPASPFSRPNPPPSTPGFHESEGGPVPPFGDFARAAPWLQRCLCNMVQQFIIPRCIHSEFWPVPFDSQGIRQFQRQRFGGMASGVAFQRFCQGRTFGVLASPLRRWRHVWCGRGWDVLHDNRSIMGR